MDHHEALRPDVRSWMSKVAKSVQGAQREVKTERLPTGLRFQFRSETPINLEEFEGRIQVVRFIKTKSGEYKNKSASFERGTAFEHVADCIVEFLQIRNV